MARQSLHGTRLHIIIPDVTRKQLQGLCKQTGLTAAEHVRRALDRYLAEVVERQRERR